jgi:acetolactate synthase-1/2/3 large subunit
MKLTVADAIIKMLEYEKTKVIFGYPGAATCPIYDSLTKSTIKHILMRQEQNTAHAANGYARVSQEVGVCLATSGPGATNLITGIATAYMDSIPIVALTGQVSTDLIGKDVFQEVDITGATAPFCKHNYLAKDAEEVPRIIHEAFYIAKTGRPGPVLIDIPVDIQNTEIEFEYPKKIEIRGYNPTYKGHELQLKRIADAIKNSSKPVICAGGGVISSNASKELIALSEEVGIPVTNTLMGKGCMPENHKNYLGMIGSHGVYAANKAISNADLLLVIGARAGDRATNNSDKFAYNAKIVHIDIDPAEIGKNIGTNIPVVGDAKTILEQMRKHVKCEYKTDWIKSVHEWKRSRSDKIEINKNNYVNPKYVLSELSNILKGNAIVTTEVGQNQIWAVNFYDSIHPRKFLTSGGLGTMGYGLPAAIGAKFAKEDETIIAIAGDGSFQMNLNELATMNQWGKNIIIILFNNGVLGMVRELQKLKYSKNYSGIDLSGSPDFVKIADAYGIKAERIIQNSDVKEALEKVLNQKDSYLLEFIVDPDESTL